MQHRHQVSLILFVVVELEGFHDIVVEVNDSKLCPLTIKIKFKDVDCWLILVATVVGFTLGSDDFRTK